MIKKDVKKGRIYHSITASERYYLHDSGLDIYPQGI
jgi:hypothetical protein